MKNKKTQDQQLTDQAKKLLCEINQVWKSLQQEPKGRYVSGYHLLPPSQTNYWNNIEKLNKLLIDLDNEKILDLPIPFFEFRHTMNKECSYVKDFTPNKKHKESVNNEELIRLMNEANNHISRDLYSILELSQSISNNK